MTTETSMTPRESGRAEATRERPMIAPRVDIYENQDEILVVADLPGVEKKDVTIRLEKHELTLSARREMRLESSSAIREFASSEYYRAFVVPDGIDADRIRAEMTNGVLRVHLPKAEAIKPRRIEVQAG